MLKGKTVAVVVQAYNEETQIGTVIETMPDFVDRIVIVNDCSKDGTAKVVEKYIKDNGDITIIKEPNKKISPTKYNKAEFILADIQEKEASLFVPSEVVNKNPEKNRVILINHLVNGGVGAAMTTGYKWCRDHGIFCTGLMGGDGQMDPSELENICLPVVDGEVDFVKANRLKHRSALFVIPKIRFFGNSILSLLTKVASGYWKVSDSQTGFTAISLPALKSIRLHQIYPSYGCPNDLLVKLNIAFCTLKEVESKPVYKVGEKSKMNELKVVPPISWLLFKLFFRRLYVKYLFRDFHPLFIFYNFAILMFLANIPVTIRIFVGLARHQTLTVQILLAFVLFTIGGIQSLCFAMWMDMMDNDRLQK